MPTCFNSSGRTPTLCIGSDANCAAALGATARNAAAVAAAAASDARSVRCIANLADANILAARLLAHFVVFVALQDVAARAGLVLISNVGHKRRGVADASGNISGGARGQALLQRQFHGAIYRDAHYAVVFVRPTIAVQKFVLAFAVGMELGARFHLQARGGRQDAGILKWRSGLAEALHFAVEVEEPSHGDENHDEHGDEPESPVQQSAGVGVAAFVAFVRAIRRRRLARSVFSLHAHAGALLQTAGRAAAAAASCRAARNK